jgi:hypothetical protein
MSGIKVAVLLLASLSGAAAANAGSHAVSCASGALVGASVEIDGRPAPLYPAPDGSGRFYLEARPGSRYSIALANRSGERVGVVLSVDGLNAISGTRDAGRGRMYVLDPWQQTTVAGWRTSLAEVRQFTFVDERSSYAARVGKANEKMGWIELGVYRERAALAARRRLPEPLPAAPEEADARTNAGHAEGEGGRAKSSADAASAPARSYPGTGWGREQRDEVVLVSFEPETSPCETLTLRYEYRPALVALGVLPRAFPPRDRLQERDGGFAPPPLW